MKTVLVTDASVVVPAIVFDGAYGKRVRGLFRGEALLAPEVVDVECVSVLRRLTRSGEVPVARARLALSDLRNLSVRRMSHTPLLDRIWELRDNLSACDASYVALAEAVGATLLTADSKLAKAPGLHCDIKVLRP